MSYLKKHIVTILELLLLLITIFYSFQHYNSARLEGNAASRALLALGPILNIGAPYKELYEFVPPGFLIILSTWVKIFGLGMLSFRLLNVFFTLLSGLFLLLISKKLFRKKVIEFFVYSAAIISLHSGIIQTDILSLDFFGTTLALGGLTALLYIKNSVIKLMASSTLILAASQIKDIYLLPILSLVPIYLKEFIRRDLKSFLKLFFLSLLGPFTFVLLIVYYLLANSAVGGYLQVLQDKAAFANLRPPGELFLNFVFMIQIFEKNFLQLPYLMMGLLSLTLGIFILIFYQKNNKIKLKPTVWLNNYGETYQGKIFLALIYIISLLFSLTLYGQYSVDARFSAIVTSLFILLGLFLSYLNQTTNKLLKSQILRSLILTVLIVITIPKLSVFKSYNFSPSYLENYDFAIEKKIMQETDKTDCILHVYGWGVSMTYIYAERRPCTKYFLPNSLHQVKRSGMNEEYRQEVFNRSPAAILLTTELTDLDIARFEREVINFPQVLNHCYVADPTYTDYKGYFLPPVTVFYPRSDDKRELKECFIKYGQPAGSS